MVYTCEKLFQIDKIEEDEIGRTCGTYMGFGECLHGSGTEICRKGNTWRFWKICFFPANFQKSFFINTADKCIVLLHSVQCVTVTVAVRLFQLLPSAECCQFQHNISCCTVQIHIQSADLVLFRYTKGIFCCVAKFRRTNISFVMPDCPSAVCMEQLGSYWMDFHENWYFD